MRFFTGVTSASITLLVYIDSNMNPAIKPITSATINGLQTMNVSAVFKCDLFIG